MIVQRSHFHPLFHCWTTLPTAVVDVEHSALPADIWDCEDVEAVLDFVSAPPCFHERMTQVGAHLSSGLLRGRNVSDLVSRSYPVIFDRVRKIHSYSCSLETSQLPPGTGRSAPTFSLAFAPEDMQRLIDLDLEVADNHFSSYLQLLSDGAVSPVVLLPFHCLFPMIEDFDKRVAIRAGLEIFWPLLERFHQSMERLCGRHPMIIPVQFPQFAVDGACLKILCQEVALKARNTKTENPQVLLLLDHMQVENSELDVQMRALGRIDLAKAGLGTGTVWTMLTDAPFSSWVVANLPSLKRVIDRIIAKMEKDWEQKGLDYAWTCGEPLEELLHSEKSLDAFEERFAKLHQLGHIPASPDFYLRAKLMGRYKRLPNEPQEIALKQQSARNDWSPEMPSLGRWMGFYDSTMMVPFVNFSRPVTNKATGAVTSGAQGWKIAWHFTREKIVQRLRGRCVKASGGFFGILSDLVGDEATELPVRKRNVQEFLGRYCMAYYRDIFVQQKWSDADCHVRELCVSLTKETGRELTDEELAMAGVAAQGYYLMQSARSSMAVHWEQMDQSAMFDAVVRLMAAVRNYCCLCRWLGRHEEVNEIFALVRESLFEFEQFYDRGRLGDYGVTQREWQESLQSQVEEDSLNIVARASRFAAASQLKKFGFRFRDDDPPVVTDRWVGTACGHIWSPECAQSYLKWENKQYCGVTEE